MKTLRLTPINIACAGLLAWVLWNLLDAPLSWPRLIGQLVLVMLLVLADQFFRLFLRHLKRIWIAELGFLAFTVLVLWMLR